MDWATVVYNHGDNFDGTYFMAPEDGIYAFNLTAEQMGDGNYGVISLIIETETHAKQYCCTPNQSSLTISTFVHLKQDQLVSARFQTRLHALNDPWKTYFEGILIQKTG